MKRFSPRISPRATTSLLDVVGIALIVATAAVIYWPAALALAGIGCLAISWRVS